LGQTGKGEPREKKSIRAQHVYYLWANSDLYWGNYVRGITKDFLGRTGSV
jgi:hypothetical protein